MASRPGWHRGEDSIHAKLGYDKVEDAVDLYKWIRLELPHDGAEFYSSKVQYLPMCILDEDNRPWVSILCSKDGQLGYIHYPEHNTLEVEAILWKGDPFVNCFEAMKLPSLFAAVGIEVSTRTRNKFAGNIVQANLDGGLLKLKLKATQAIGNCPKYISIRDLHTCKSTACVVQEQKLHMTNGERLPEAIVEFILKADSSILGTVYEALPQDVSIHPSHLGANHRGGKPGFLRVKPSDGRTIILPDFSGDRIMTSLGNIEVTPLAALTIISFDTGDILYITGKARNVHGADARAIMPLQSLLTEIHVTGYTLVLDAFPARQRLGVQPIPSPYNPPLKYLAEEDSHSTIFSGNEQSKAKLARIVLHSPTIATFEWESSVSLHIDPGQAIILDLGPWLGTREFHHIWDEKPGLVNDDFIRTWTISSLTSAQSGSRHFSVTLREKEGGTVTGPLFKIAKEVLGDSERALPSLDVNIVGTSGTFVLPPSTDTTRDKIQLLWIAGGIGLTPFLSMLAAISRGSKHPSYDIMFLLSTREPDVTLKLLYEALDGSKIPHWLSIHIFSNASSLSASPNTQLRVEHHVGRLGRSFLEIQKDLLNSPNAQIFICGPESFERSVIAGLGTCGVDIGRIHREGFSY